MKKYLAILLLFSTEAHGNEEAFKARWEHLCSSSSLSYCPRLVTSEWRLSKDRHGIVKCGCVKKAGSRYRRCPEVSVYLRAPINTLDHEFAHVLQWTNGANNLRHGPRFIKELNKVRKL